MSNKSISHSPTSHNRIAYLESRLAEFAALAANAWTPRWRNFWTSQADSIRQELKAKMVNPAISPIETGETDAY